MHTALKLKSVGAFPLVIDNVNDYYDVSLKEMRIDKLKDNDVEFQKIDLCDADGLEQLFREHHFDYVLHLAAQAGVRYSIKTLWRTFVLMLNVLLIYLK
eukprot:UN26454